MAGNKTEDELRELDFRFFRDNQTGYCEAAGVMYVFQPAENNYKPISSVEVVEPEPVDVDEDE